MVEDTSPSMFLVIKSQRIPLYIGQLYLLGKQVNGSDNSTRNFIKLELEEVEEKHCVVEVAHSEEVFVYDLFTSTGTLVNARPLRGLEKLRLQNGDILKVGKEEIKYIHDRADVSHDSSGFLEVNKNTSDIIASSPDCSSQHESRTKRANNFRVPSVPAMKTVTLNNSLVTPETEVNSCRNSLNDSTNSLCLNNRRSDSFTIPETQHCKPRNSLNGSDLSIAESIPETNASKIKFNFGNLDDVEDDDFCIPETQEVVISIERPRILDGHVQEKSTVPEETVDSQFRICTQDYNEGFGEETDEALTSQIIPLISHNMVNMINKTEEGLKVNTETKTKSNDEDKEMSALKWNNYKLDQQTTILTTDCCTPDIFDFDNVEQEQANVNVATDKSTVPPQPNVMDEDDEDFLPTQVFSLIGAKSNENKLQKIPFLDKENEEFLPLSDKENRYPSLEPIADLPPTQLFAPNEAAKASNSSNSVTNVLKTNANNSKFLLDLDPDNEDELLTQAFMFPSNPSPNSLHKNVPVKLFNSTVLEDKCVTKNPATFFTELETSALKPTVAVLAFKKPDMGFVKKTSSTTSTTTETDMDLLMCTPQLIKEHLHVDKSDDLRQNILAVKNKHLFGDDTDNEDEEAETENDQDVLVKLINKPKNSLDFDKLLPHLNKKTDSSKISEEGMAAKESNKLHKFNVTFGKEQDEHQSKSPHSKSSTLSRDERHVARDKERALAERKETLKIKDSSKEKKKQTKSKQNDSAAKTKDDKETNTMKTEKPSTRTKSEEEKKPQKTETTSKTKNDIEKKIKRTEPSTTPRNEKDQNKSDKTKRSRKTNTSPDKSNEPKKIKGEEQPLEMPARRMTRSKSKFEETSTTSKATSSKSSKTDQNGDDLDSVATQPFVRVTRCRSSFKQSESRDNIRSKSSSHKSEQSDKGNKINRTSKSHNATKTSGERKRKAETTPANVPAKQERKSLRNSRSQESSTTSQAKSSSSSSSAGVSISMTMVDPELCKSLIQHSKGVWSIAKIPGESEVLVMDKSFRTFKFLLAMARGIPIVTSEYLKRLNEAKSAKKVRIPDYLFKDEDFEKKHKFSLLRSQEMAKKHKLFNGYEFVMTASILPNPQEIRAIIEVSGGLVHAKTPPAPKENQKIYLVSAKEDKKDWLKFRRLNKNIVIVSTEAIMSAVMRQSCERINCYTLV